MGEKHGCNMGEHIMIGEGNKFDIKRWEELFMVDHYAYHTMYRENE